MKLFRKTAVGLVQENWIFIKNFNCDLPYDFVWEARRILYIFNCQQQKIIGKVFQLKFCKKNIETNSTQVYPATFHDALTPLPYWGHSISMNHWLLANKSLVHFCASSKHRIECCQSVREGFKIKKLPGHSIGYWSPKLDFLLLSGILACGRISSERDTSPQWIFQFVGKFKESATGNVYFNLRHSKLLN